MSEENSKVEEPQQAYVAKRLSIEIDSHGICKMEAYVSDNGKDFIAMPLRDQRNMLQEGMWAVGDKITATFMVAYIDNMMAQKVKPNGFRQSSVKDFLFGSGSK